MERRTFLRTAAGGGAGIALGAFALVGIGRFHISDQQYQGQLLGPTVFELLVENDGGSFGDAKVKVQVYDGTDTVLASNSTVVSVPGGKSRKVELECEVPDDADRYSATANLNL